MKNVEILIPTLRECENQNLDLKIEVQGLKIRLDALRSAFNLSLSASSSLRQCIVEGKVARFDFDGKVYDVDFSNVKIEKLS